MPEIDTPHVLSKPEYSTRIIITAFEHFMNDREERITFIGFDTIVPLSNKPSASTSDTPTRPLAQPNL